MIAGLTPCSTPRGAHHTKLRIINPLAISRNAAHTRTTVFEEGIWQRMPYPVLDAVWVAKAAGLVFSKGETGVKVWKLRGEDGVECILDMELSVTTNLRCGSASEDGRWLAVSDAVEVKLFRLGELREDGSFADKPFRVKTIAATVMAQLPTQPSSSMPPAAASKLVFTPDSSRLIVACSPSSSMLVLELSSTGDVDVSRMFPQHAESAGTGRTTKAMPGNRNGGDGDGVEESSDEKWIPQISAIAVSYDGQWLASADDFGRVYIFNLDSLQHHCTLPSFSLPIQSLVFDPDRPSVLILAQPNNTLHVFDVESRTFPRWAKRVCEHIPEAFRALKPGVEGLLFVKAAKVAKKHRQKNKKMEQVADNKAEHSSETKHHLLAWGWNWICHIDLEGGRVDAENASLIENQGKGRLLHESTVASHESAEANFKTVMTYRQMLLVADFGEGQIVVVERPLMDVLTAKGQPPPFYKPKYGTG